MIPLEKQVVSLSLATEMRDLGYPQDGLWWWVKHFGHLSINLHKEDSLCVAPTFPEVSKALPPDVYVCQKALWYKSIRIEIDHIDNDINKPLNYLEAFAKMWVCLKKGRVK